MQFVSYLRKAKRWFSTRSCYREGKYLYKNEFCFFLFACLAVLTIILMLAFQVVILFLINYNLTFGMFYDMLFWPEIFKTGPPLVNTSTCRIDAWPALDEETHSLFSRNVKSSFNFCPQSERPPADLLTIRRHNYTWIEINKADNDSWYCVAKEVQRVAKDDFFQYGQEIVHFTKRFTDFTAKEINIINGTETGRWDFVLVFCAETGSNSFQTFNSKNGINSNQRSLKSYTQVVPLVQHYTQSEKKVPESSQVKKANILLLGLDAISRLHFNRHLPKTKQLLEEKGFQPLYGYHKVGLNSFPNVLPILSGRPVKYFVNSSNDSNGTQTNQTFSWDRVHLLFNDLHDAGYLSTFIEDMPNYGFFNYDHKGFTTEQPTTYYLRPFNLAIRKDLKKHTCYKGSFEVEIYYEYILDMLSAFKARGEQRFFIFNHESTMTHDHFNNAGLLDAPLHTLLDALFKGGYNANTVIVIFADHALRIGPIMKTMSAVHEARLPLFYIYLPDELVLDGRGVEELRDVMAINAHRLTSHFDLHATLMHLLRGNEVKDTELVPYGRSLLGKESISENRNCEEAGILLQYCLCFWSMKKVEVNSTGLDLGQLAVKHINGLIDNSYAKDMCYPLKLDVVIRETITTTFSPALQEGEKKTGKQLIMVQFRTAPNWALFEVLFELEMVSNFSSSLVPPKVLYTNRLTEYWSESKCIQHDRVLSPICLCMESYHHYFAYGALPTD